MKRPGRVLFAVWDREPGGGGEDLFFVVRARAFFVVWAGSCFIFCYSGVGMPSGSHFC